MKNFITLLMIVIFSLSLYAQDKGYVHTTTADNISGTHNHATLLDLPELNNNPGAKVLFSQRYINGSGSDNPNPTGIFYDDSQSRWGIFNENLAAMPEGLQFNIYIADDSEVVTHVTDASNTVGHETFLDGYAQIDYLFYNTSYEPNEIYNPNVYGNYWNGAERRLYEEDYNPIPIGSGFKVMKGLDTSATQASVYSTSSNIDGRNLILDIPELNDNPDAVFLYSHYWGYGGDTGVYLPTVTDVYYSSATGTWRIYAYDMPFPENVGIDIIIPDEIIILGTDEVQQEFSKISLYPNPAVDMVSIASSKENIQAVEIYDVSGKMVQSFKDSGKSVSINVSALPSGMYIAKVLTDEGWFSKKLIKK